jgi:hypothetical protein
MATATATKQRAVKVAAGRVVSAKPRLLMIIGGVEYEAALFEDDDTMKSAGHIHLLRAPRGAWFEVYTRWGLEIPRADRNWCDRCQDSHCPHLDAMVQFNLMCD